MRVLLQEWRDCTTEKLLTSISKGQLELDGAIKEHAPKDVEDPEENTAIPIEEPRWVEIPDDHGLSEMVEANDTVFLEPDEEDIITDIPEE